MKLTLGNFFSRLIFHPFEADTKIDRMIALVVSITCGVFSFGLCHAICALRTCFAHRPSNQATEQALKMTKVKKSILDLPEPLPSLKNPSKSFTELLFDGSKFSLDSLPVYPIVLSENKRKPEIKHMTYPVMKGKNSDGLPFISIIIDKMKETKKGQYVISKDLFLLTFSQSQKGNSLVWGELGGDSDLPFFCSGDIMHSDAGALDKDKKTEFESVQTLLQRGFNRGLNGVLWAISDFQSL